MKQKHLMIVFSILALVISSFMITGNAGAVYLHDGSLQSGTTGLLGVTNTYCVGPDQTGATNNATKILSVTAANCSTSHVTVTTGQAAYVASLTTEALCTGAGYRWSYTTSGSSNEQPLIAGPLTAFTTGSCTSVFWTGDIDPNDANEASTAGNGISWFTYGNEGCLRCHNTGYMGGGPGSSHNAPFADKSSYLLTGHRNMLRKVTPGYSWAGPSYSCEGAVTNVANAGKSQAVCQASGGTWTAAYNVYTTDGTNAINFPAGTMTSSSKSTPANTTLPLYYIFGDWIPASPNPYLISDNGSGTKAEIWEGGTTPGSSYSCANCHTAGYANCQDKTGYCSITSTAANASQSACTAAGGYWLYATGVVNGGAIGGTTSCIPGNQPLSSFPNLTNSATTPASANGITASWDVDGIRCSRCHNAANPAYKDASGHLVFSTHNNTPSGTYVTNLCVGCHNSYKAGQTDPAQIGVTVNSAGVGSISNHEIGMQYLNGPHGLFTGTMVENELGEKEINLATGTWASVFVTNVIVGGTLIEGFTGTCSVGGVTYENQTTGTCASLNGTWSSTTSPEQGSCETCHDVHNSITPGQSVAGGMLASSSLSTQTVGGVTTVVNNPASIKRECITCHGGNYAIQRINHPFGAGTPLANYSTNATTGNVVTPDSSGCVICHMAKLNSNVAPMHVFRVSGDPNYSTFPTYAQYSAGQLYANTEASTPGAGSGSGPYNASYSEPVWVDVDLACGQCHGGSAGSTAVKNGAPYKDKPTLAQAAQIMHGIPTTIAIKVTVSYGTDGKTVTLTDASSAANDTSSAKATISVLWGDGSAASTGTEGGSLSHAFAGLGTYSIVYTVTDSSTFTTASKIVQVDTGANGTTTISGQVTDGNSNPLQGVTLALKNSSTPPVTVAIATTDVNGDYEFHRVVAGTYTVTGTKTCYSFTPLTSVSAGSSTANLTGTGTCTAQPYLPN